MAIRGSKIFGERKRFLNRKNPTEVVRTRPSKDPNKRQKSILRLVKKYGPTKAVRKLKMLARKNPEYSKKIWNDATWLVGQLSSSRKRQPGGSIPHNSEIDLLLAQPNPDFEWGPKLFNPLTDHHPFEKNPVEDTGGLFTSLYQRKNKNPDTGGLFTSIYNRKGRNSRS